MPTYEYRCERGHQYDLIQSYDAEKAHECQECMNEGRDHPFLAHRQLSVPAVKFKGDGWTTGGGSRKLWDNSQGYEHVSDSVKERDAK